MIWNRKSETVDYTTNSNWTAPSRWKRGPELTSTVSRLGRLPDMTPCVSMFKRKKMNSVILRSLFESVLFQVVCFQRTADTPESLQYSFCWEKGEERGLIQKCLYRHGFSQGAPVSSHSDLTRVDPASHLKSATIGSSFHMPLTDHRYRQRMDKVIYSFRRR